MKVSLIDSMEAFEKVRPGWEEVYNQDPTSTIFTSWAWFRGWLQGTSWPWRILALHPDQGKEYVAFFPIGLRGRRRKGMEFSEIFIGGNSTSDHTGFLCLPRYWSEAGAAIAAYLQEKMTWDVFHLRDVFDPKVDALADAFPPKNFEVHRAAGQICPYIPLPENWESYLRILGRRPRKQFRQFHRDFEQKKYRVEVADPSRFEMYLGILVDLHRQKWPQKTEASLEIERLLLRNCFAAGTIYLPVLFYQEKPIAAMVEFIDRKNSTLAGFMTGWDFAHEKLSPAKRLQSHVIRYAIENNYKCYDFLRGDEAYKQDTFGSAIRCNQDVVIYRKNVKQRLRCSLTCWL